MKTQKRYRFPLPGMRIIKSVIAVFLGFLIYVLRGFRGLPVYTAFSVLQCIQPLQKNSREVGIRRMRGTLIGAVFGLVSLTIEQKIPEEQIILLYLIVSVFCGVVIYSTVLMQCPDSAYFACTVFLGITINHVTDTNAFLFAFNRLVDTMIGVVLALAVNAFELPRKKRRDVLFVSGVDDVILDKTHDLSDYSRIELNRLIESGCSFTIQTTETAATIREMLGGVNLKLPIITMDGAVLYDMTSREYLEAVVMPAENSRRLIRYLDEKGLSFFINTIIENLLVIYYGELKNEAVQSVYTKRKVSPYRNYVRRQGKTPDNVVYVLLLDKKEIIDEIYEELQTVEWGSNYMIHYELSRYYDGYAYMKIYDKSVSRESMLEKLKERLGMYNVIRLGHHPSGEHDVYVGDSKGDIMVKTLRRLYEPLWFQTFGDGGTILR